MLRVHLADLGQMVYQPHSALLCAGADWAWLASRCTSSDIILKLWKQEFTFLFLVSFFVPCRKFGLPFLGEAQQLQEQRYPFLSVCVVFSCVQAMVRLPASGIVNVHTDDDACSCTWGLYGHGGCTDMGAVRTWGLYGHGQRLH